MSAPRFGFGKNWQSFVGVLTEERIREAEASLVEMIGAERLRGATFIDVGSGSGVFSLAAARLGARKVHSFDFDADSVAATEMVRERYGPPGVDWRVEPGSALDPAYLGALGQWDVVYSWGVLHHTGAMWQALENVLSLVTPCGTLFISIYNDQGPVSRGWTWVKRTYNRSRVGRIAVLSAFVPYFIVRGVFADTLRARNPVTRYRDYRRTRGMSMTHDWADWLGGYPFEVARPEEIFDFYRARGLSLVKLKTCGGRLGCNEFVFQRLNQLTGSYN